MGRKCGNAERDRNRSNWLPLVHYGELPCLGSHPLGPRPGSVQARARQNQEKLFAPEAARNILCPGSPGEGSAHLAQDRVARFMTKCVVESFEMVQIKHDQAQLLLRSCRPPQFAFQAFLQVAAVVEPSEGIARRLLPQRLLQP